MINLLRQRGDICRFRRGPQDLPYSPAIFRGVVLCSAGAGLLFARVVYGSDRGIAELAVSLLLMLAIPWLLLTVRGVPSRYSQTLIALAGTGILFTLIYMPFASALAGLPAVGPDTVPTRQHLALAWVTLALIGWKLAINGHIWRHAMNWPMFGGVALALGTFVFEIGVMRLLFASSGAAE